MNLGRESGQFGASKINYWPVLVPAVCIALWWPILAFAFNARVATVFAIVATCLLAMVVALALLADALGIHDGLLRVDEDVLLSIDKMARGQASSQEPA